MLTPLMLGWRVWQGHLQKLKQIMRKAKRKRKNVSRNGWKIQPEAQKVKPRRDQASRDEKDAKLNKTKP